MKLFVSFTLIAASNFSILLAKDLSPFEDDHVENLNRELKQASFSRDSKAMYLTKLLDYQQKMYDSKIAMLEAELSKTKNLLQEKTLAEHTLEEKIHSKYQAENRSLKNELAYKNKSLMEFQRAVEKISATDEVKQMIKLNTKLASDLRKYEDQVAVYELRLIESSYGQKAGNRLPASVKEK